MKSHYDTIVVGGGPAGSTCATLLARGGHNVALIDKARFPRDKICGDCVNPRCWDIFELLGVADILQSQPLQIVTAVGISNASGRRIFTELPTSGSRPFFSIKRSVLDTILLRNAERAGVHVFEETLLTDVHGEGPWETVLQGKRRLTCDILVGADGRNSLVARKLHAVRGVTRSATARTRDNRVGIQWHAGFQHAVNSSVEMFLFDHGYGGVVNVDRETANVAMVTTTGTVSSKPFSEFLDRTLYQNARAKQLFPRLDPVGKISITYPITPSHHGSAHSSAILIGDANRTVEPFTGEGIFFALQDGVNASRRILKSERQLPETIFDRRGTRFWANHIYSPTLQLHRPAGLLVSVAAAFPSLVPAAMKAIIPANK